MAGKSTFIKSVGLSVFLAHMGMGVPAAAMKLTFLMACSAILMWWTIS